MNLADTINLAIAIISGLSAVASFAVCLATFRILKATKDALAATQSQMFAARRPYIDISARVESEQPVITLVVRNSGSSSADRVRLKFDRAFMHNGSASSQDISKLPIFSQIIEAIGARSEFRVMLGVGHTIFARPDLSPLKFSVLAEYSFEGVPFFETSMIDLEAFTGHSVGKAPQTIALEKIGKAIEAIASSLKK